MYQSRGVLPPPRRSGRRAFYGPAHLDRLRRIDELRRQGFSLAGIKKLLDAYETGATLGAVLGIGPVGPRRLVLSAPQLAARFPGLGLTPEVMVDVMAAGLVVVRDDAKYVVLDARVLDLASALGTLGVPPERVMTEWRAVRSITDEVALRFAAVFDDHLRPPFAPRPGDDPAVALAQASATLDRLMPLAKAMVDAALDAALTRTVDRLVAGAP